MAKAIRYSLHDFLIKRIYTPFMLQRQKQSSLDEKLTELVLAEQENHEYNLWDKEKKKRLCDPELLKSLTRDMLLLEQAETPGQKATIFRKAIRQAEELIVLSDSKWNPQSPFGAEDRTLLYRYFLLYYIQNSKNKRLFEQLLFTLIFNIPQNEIINKKCFKKYNSERASEDTDYSEIGKWEKFDLWKKTIYESYQIYDLFGQAKVILEKYLAKEDLPANIE